MSNSADEKKQKKVAAKNKPGTILEYTDDKPRQFRDVGAMALGRKTRKIGDQSLVKALLATGWFKTADSGDGKGESS